MNLIVESLLAFMLLFFIVFKDGWDIGKVNLDIFFAYFDGFGHGLDDASFVIFGKGFP